MVTRTSINVVTTEDAFCLLTAGMQILQMLFMQLSECQLQKKNKDFGLHFDNEKLVKIVIKCLSSSFGRYLHSNNLLNDTTCNCSFPHRDFPLSWHLIKRNEAQRVQCYKPHGTDLCRGVTHDSFLVKDSVMLRLLNKQDDP